MPAPLKRPASAVGQLKRCQPVTQHGSRHGGGQAASRLRSRRDGDHAIAHGDKHRFSASLDTQILENRR